jgi:hypothetical protein
MVITLEGQADLFVALRYEKEVCEEHHHFAKIVVMPAQGLALPFLPFHHYYPVYSIGHPTLVYPIITPKARNVSKVA